MRVAVFSVAVALSACSSPGPIDAGSREPMRCRTELVPFLAPFGIANAAQTITFHFRANVVCNVGGHEPTATVVLRTPSNDVVPLDSVETGRVESWLGEANVFVVRVTVQLPDVPMVRATFQIEGMEVTRDVYLVTPPDDLRTVTWSAPPARWIRWWELGPDERVNEAELGNDNAYSFSQGVTQLNGTAPLAATPDTLFVGNEVIERATGMKRQTAFPVPAGVAAVGNELFAITRERELLRVVADAGTGFVTVATIAKRRGLIATVMAADGDQLLIGFEPGPGEDPALVSDVHVEIRSANAPGDAGTIVNLPGTQLMAGSNRIWASTYSTVSAVSADGGVVSIARPQAGFPLFRDAPGPTRPAFLVPTVVDSPNPFSEHPYVWYPTVRADGSLGAINITVDDSTVAVNEQRLFLNGKSAPIPDP